MKSLKLSLATAIAFGSFSCIDATPLDEAINNVDFSGYLRYRFDTKNAEKNKIKENGQTHSYKARLGISANISDNFKAHAVMEYEAKDGSYGKDAKLNDNKTFIIKDAFLSYEISDFQVALGRMEIDTIWTDDLLGNGLKLTNNSLDKVTLQAYFYDNYNKDGDLGLIKLKNGEPTSKNLYGAMIGVDYEPVNAKIYASSLASWGTFYAADIVFSGGDDFKYHMQAQYAGNSLKNDRKDKLKLNGKEATNGNFYGVEAGIKAFGANISLGYVGFGKKDKWTLNSIEDHGKLLKVGGYAMNGSKSYQGSIGKKDFIYGVLGYKYDAFKANVEIVSGTNKLTNGKEKLFEVRPQLSYKYSKKLVFKTRYTYGETKDVGGVDGVKNTEKKVRFEAKYNF